MMLLDGPLGTELARRGVETPLPRWSAGALETHPEVVRAIHAAYADAGAELHTTNTFRTRPATCGKAWASLARRAVALARTAPGRVLGSIAPLADCYAPADSPWHADPQATEDAHLALAEVLVDAGCDVLLCETFPLVNEALAAVHAARRTGAPVWVALTAGPSGDLLTPEAMAEGARRAADLGAEAVLVNCTPALETARFVEALASAVPEGIRIGAYANAGHADEEMGWTSDEVHPDGVTAYVDLARRWRDAGATILGSCCGTGPEHVRALAAAFRTATTAPGSL